MTSLFLYILFAHWVADFVFQTNKMAKNKSTSLFWLSNHICEYQAVLLILLWLTDLRLGRIVIYVLVNGIAHLIIDFVTSKINSKLWAKGKVHWFFVSVGFDQFFHVAILLITIGGLIN